MIKDDVEKVQELYSKLARSPLGMATEWERKASAGKPILYGGKRGLLAYGTIATWDEFDFIAAVTNAWPTIYAAFDALNEGDGKQDLASTKSVLAATREHVQRLETQRDEMLKALKGAEIAIDDCQNYRSHLHHKELTQVRAAIAAAIRP